MLRTMPAVTAVLKRARSMLPDALRLDAAAAPLAVASRGGKAVLSVRCTGGGVMSGLALNQRVRSGRVPPLAEGFTVGPRYA